MIHRRVAVGQLWRSNDARNLRGVRVTRIRKFSTGEVASESLVTTQAQTEPALRDKIVVTNVVTHRETVLRRDQFATGVRGWSLDRDVPAPASV